MNEDKEPTLDVARRILAELAEMTEHASLTQGLRGGEKAAAQAYNRVLASFSRTGAVAEGMFEPLDPEGTDFGTLAVQCRLLLAVVSGDRKREKDRPNERLDGVIALAPFLDSDDLGRMVMERLGESGTIPDGLLVGLAPFLESGMLGQIVRRNLRSPTPPSPPMATTPPPKSQGPLEDLETNIAKIRDLARTQTAERRDELLARADEFESRKEEYQGTLTAAAPPEAPATLESLAAELRRPDLTMEERQRIAMRLAELSYEQSVQAPPLNA